MRPFAYAILIAFGVLASACGGGTNETATAPGTLTPVPSHTAAQPNSPPLSPVETPKKASKVTPDQEQKLIAAVRKSGTVRVIVTLEVPAGAKTKIAEAQDALLAELKTAKNARRYSDLPLLAVTVDEAALMRLLSSDRVKGVQLDGLKYPK